MHHYDIVKRELLKGLDMTLIDQLSIEYVNITGQGFESAMTLGEFHKQPFGFLNGGAILAYCEIIAGMVSNKLGEAEYEALKASMSITDNDVKTVDFEVLKAKAVDSKAVADIEKLAKGPYVAVGQSVTGQHLNAIKAEGRVIATGTLLKQGKRNHVWQIDVRSEAGVHVSQVTVVNALIYPMGAKRK